MRHSRGDRTDHGAVKLGSHFTVIGGINTPTGGTMTWPLARLDATTERVVLRSRLRLPGFVMDFLGPDRGPWVLPRADVVTVRPASGQIRFFNTGVELAMRDHSLWIFWHPETQGVLDALAGLGYPVRHTYP